jgi:hypothetical protein
VSSRSSAFHCYAFYNLDQRFALRRVVRVVPKRSVADHEPLPLHSAARVPSSSGSSGPPTHASRTAAGWVVHRHAMPLGDPAGTVRRRQRPAGFAQRLKDCSRLLIGPSLGETRFTSLARRGFCAADLPGANARSWIAITQAYYSDGAQGLVLTLWLFLAGMMDRRLTRSTTADHVRRLRNSHRFAALRRRSNPL